MSTKKRIDLKLSAELYDKFKAIAIKKQVTVSTLLRLIMQEYIENEKSK